MTVNNNIFFINYSPLTQKTFSAMSKRKQKMLDRIISEEQEELARLIKVAESKYQEAIVQFKIGAHKNSAILFKEAVEKYNQARLLSKSENDVASLQLSMQTILLGFFSRSSTQLSSVEVDTQQVAPKESEANPHQSNELLDEQYAPKDEKGSEFSVAGLPVANATKFVTVVQIVPHYDNLPDYPSHFTDEQAIRLCANMTCSVPRRAAQGVKLGTPDTFEYKKCRYELHFLANKALLIYGVTILKFFYNLKQLEFADSSAAKLKKILTNKSFGYATVDFPTVTFMAGDFKEYSLVFTHDKELTNSELRRTPQVKIYSRAYRCKVGSIDRHGKIVNALAGASIKLDLFLTSLNQANEYEMRLGVANGYCLICGAELKNSDSKRRGIGPDCLRQL